MSMDANVDAGVYLDVGMDTELYLTCTNLSRPLSPQMLAGIIHLDLFLSGVTVQELPLTCLVI